MANKLTQAQQKQLELKQAEAKINDEIIEDMIEFKSLGMQLTDIQEKKLSGAVKEKTIKEESITFEILKNLLVSP